MGGYGRKVKVYFKDTNIYKYIYKYINSCLSKSYKYMLSEVGQSHCLKSNK